MTVLTGSKNTCSTCGDRLPAYFAVMSPPQGICTLCHVLAPHQQGGTFYAPRRALEGRWALAQQERGPSPTVPPPEDAEREAGIAQLVAWAKLHDNTWPCLYDLRRDTALPSVGAVCRLWGGITPLRNVLSLQYPTIRAPGMIWTPPVICEAFRAWIERHPGAIPLTKDLWSDRTLPGMDAIHNSFRGLEKFYRVFESGQYYAQFAQTLHRARTRAGRQGHKARLAKRRAS